MFKTLDIHADWLTNRVEYIGVDNIKSITPPLPEGWRGVVPPVLH